MKINTYIKATPKFREILGSVIGQMSDGIWENTPSMEKYWKSLDYDVDANDNIIIEDKWGVCANPVEFFANKIKQIIKIEIDDGNTDLEWNRSCSGHPNYIGYYTNVTVGDCYQLYELLKGRNTAKHTYSTMNEYKVEVSFNGTTKVYTVEALNEYNAKAAARDLATKEITLKII